ncbi:hypothetical protein HYPSUDRAFT_115728, partial [Hypholoma sublateritium FD-334 SS-4]
LRKWAHPGRRLELTDALITSLLFLECAASLQVLRQLKEPRDRVQAISVGSIQNRSLVVPVSLLAPVASALPIDVGAALVDCGASKKGYIHTDFVLRHALPTIPLPHPIGVYNADGSLNSGGAITHLCELSMRIGDHEETLLFRITNTGS